MQLNGRLLTPRVRRGRLAAIALGVALAAGVLPAATGVLPGARTAVAHAEDDTVSQNSQRSAWDPQEPGLSPTVVSGADFGPLPGFPVRLYGQIYAQPLVVGHTVIVATETDRVYGINGSDGKLEWKTRLGAPEPFTACSDLTPRVGVTSTPVYDASTGLVYVLAQVGSAYKLFGVNPASGATTTIATIGGRPTNDSHITFSANDQLQRTGLLLKGGWVYAAFGSHCDHKPWAGFVTAVNVSSHARTLWTDEAGLTDDKGGIWQSGGGLIADASGRIYFASGNGVSPPPGPGGGKTPSQLGDSVVRLVHWRSGIHAEDFFSPSNAPTLDATDRDFGSGGPIVLPFHTYGYGELIVQAGKDGRVFVLNAGKLGGRNSSNNNAALAVAGPFGGQWDHPAAFGDTTLGPDDTTADDYVYYLGSRDALRVLRFGTAGDARPTVTAAANSSSTFADGGQYGYGSGSPVVTSNGSDPSSAVVWAVSRDSSGNGTLLAYPATPSAAGWPAGCTAGCSLNPLASESVGTATKFSTPATSNNAVYVGNLAGELYAFGPTGAGGPALSAPAATFPPAATGTTVTRNITFTTHRTVTLTGDSVATTTSNGPSAAPQFSTGTASVTRTARGATAPVSFPVTLHPGDSLTVPVSFTPADPGGVTGTLSLTTSTAATPAASVPLSGDGTHPGIYANATAVSFALVNDTQQFVNWIPVGLAVPRQIVFTNGGTTPETITTEDLPTAPFSVTGLPRVGTSVAPGQSFVAEVWCDPTVAGRSYDDRLSVGSAEGTATVSLISKSLAPTSLFQASPVSVNLGSVPVGKRTTVTVTVTNTGNEPATMDGSSVLSAPFHATYKVTPRLPVNSGDDLKLPVTFTPARTGTFTVNYKITWTDVTGTHTLTIPITGTGV